ATIQTRPWHLSQVDVVVPGNATDQGRRAYPLSSFFALWKLDDRFFLARYCFSLLRTGCRFDARPPAQLSRNFGLLFPFLRSHKIWRGFSGGGLSRQFLRPFGVQLRRSSLRLAGLRRRRPLSAGRSSLRDSG